MTHNFHFAYRLLVIISLGQRDVHPGLLSFDGQLRVGVLRRELRRTTGSRYIRCAVFAVVCEFVRTSGCCVGFVV